jgi:hypothetical protein
VAEAEPSVEDHGSSAMTPNGTRCDDTLWFCEAHSNVPSDCGTSSRLPLRSAGRALIAIRVVAPMSLRRSPPGFSVTVDDKGPRN